MVREDTTQSESDISTKHNAKNLGRGGNPSYPERNVE